LLAVSDGLLDVLYGPGDEERGHAVVAQTRGLGG
jgi:hypothetical protein